MVADEEWPWQGFNEQSSIKVTSIWCVEGREEEQKVFLGVTITVFKDRNWKRMNWMYRANPKKLETQLFIIERNPEIQLFQDVCPSAEFVEKIPNMSDSIIKTTIDGWNVTTLTRICSEHQERSVSMILEYDRLKVVLHTSTVKHQRKVFGSSLLLP